MAKYINRFRSMIDAIRANESIQIVSYYFPPPATEDEILEVEIKLDFFIEEDIIDFYKEMNGFQLRWIYKENPNFDAKVHIEKEADFDFFDPLDEWYQPYDGYINILPISYIADSAEWESVIWDEDDKGNQEMFMNEDIDLYDLLKSMRPFDFYSRSMSMSFFIQKGVEKLKVLLLTSELLEPTYSRITYFSSYIEFLLVKQGNIEEREKFYHMEEGHLMDLLITEKEYWKKE